MDCSFCGKHMDAWRKGYTLSDGKVACSWCFLVHANMEPYHRANIGKMGEAINDVEDDDGRIYMRKGERHRIKGIRYWHRGHLYILEGVGDVMVHKIRIVDCNKSKGI